jgi:hypothetical protein
MRSTLMRHRQTIAQTATSTTPPDYAAIRRALLHEQRFDSTVEPAIKAELHLAQSAAEQAMHALGALVLSDIKRIADSLEILAKAELGRAALFTKGPTS